MTMSPPGGLSSPATLVLQSWRPGGPAWIDACLASVRDWAKASGFDYRFLGDEIFARVPAWYLDKCRGKRPVAADYARLLLLREALETQGYARALWLDADLLVFDPALSISFEGSCAFGREVWIQPRAGRKSGLRAVRNVHNAACAFRAGCPVLPFLIHSVESLIRRVDPARIAPQMAGPKLLTALHNIVGFELLPRIGALSPSVLRDLAAGGGPALELLRRETPARLGAANLCASLEGEAGQQTLRRAVEVLLENRGLPPE